MLTLIFYRFVKTDVEREGELFKSFEVSGYVDLPSNSGKHFLRLLLFINILIESCKSGIILGSVWVNILTIERERRPRKLDWTSGTTFSTHHH